MNWKNKLYSASYNGIPFEVESRDIETGRRKVVHNLSELDGPEVQDYGKKARTFNISGFFIGDNCQDKFNQLLDESEKSGTGTLVHPDYGSITVELLSIKSSKTSTEGRIVRFQLELIAVKDFKKFSSSVVYPDNVRDSATAAMQLAVDVYLKVLHAKNIPQRLVDSLLNTVNGALDAIGNAKKQVRTNFDYVQKFNSLKTQLNVLIQQPEQFAIILADLTTFSDETIDPVFAFKEMNELINYKTGLVYPVVSSPIALMEQSNIVRTAQFQRQIALCGAALTIPDIRFTTYDAAIYAKNIIVDGSDIVLNDVDDDSLYIAIKDLITSVVGYINTTSVDLPKKQTISINSETNSLALSQKLYGNIDHEQEIIDLNNIVHPGFIPAGIDLEVLVYA